MTQLPEEMDAIVAETHVKGPLEALSKLRIVRRPVPRPARGQVVVKMEAAPCNPADLLYIEGRYGIDRPLPAIPGFEGAGVVVASGGGAIGRWMVGKRVACGGHECSGTWAQYCLTSAQQCLPLLKTLSFEQGATALANPITALALVSMVKSRAYVQTAAASQLGRMLMKKATERGIAGIHVVRRAAQAETLRALGAEHVLISSDADFVTALRKKCHELGALIAFDAVGGSITGQLVEALPQGGEVVVYGALSGDPCGGVDPMQLAFGHKRVRGFEIAAHLKKLGLLRSMSLANAAQKRVAAGLVETQIRARVPLKDAIAGLTQYVSSMSEGKILLTP